MIINEVLYLAMYLSSLAFLWWQRAAVNLAYRVTVLWVLMMTLNYFLIFY